LTRAAAKGYETAVAFSDRSSGLPRRSFLKLVAASGAAAALPSLPGCVATVPLARTGEAHFFGARERATAEALAGAILPEGETVGALGANAVEYMDRFLAAFENPVPALFRGGPFSGRTPHPDPETGAPSRRFPENGFLHVLPPTRLQELSFRILLHGSGSVPDGDRNAPIVPSWPGLQAIYRGGLAGLDAAARAGGFRALAPGARLAAFDASPPEFQEAFLTQLAEGMFGSPEYGGNPNGIAWRDYHYDGDSQPLGHTLYDRRTQTLYDRPDQPMQGPDPAEPSQDLDPEVEQILGSLISSLGGRRFF
jgi:hypothetical protein